MNATETDEVLEALASADATVGKEAPCSACGCPVDISRTITLSLMGSELFDDQEYRSSEAAVRVVMAAMFDIEPPPVLCDSHHLYDINAPEISL